MGSSRLIFLLSKECFFCLHPAKKNEVGAKSDDFCQSIDLNESNELSLLRGQVGL